MNIPDKIRALPKADLHSHLMLSAPHNYYLKNNNNFRSSFNGFQDFVEYIQSDYLPLLTSIERRLQIVEAAIQSWISDGVVLVETSLDIMTVLRSEKNWDIFREGLTNLINAYSSKIKISLELGISRDNKLDLSACINQLLKSGLFKGVDLYGDERAAHASEFEWFYNLARDNNCYLKLHTGEQLGAERMKEELLAINPDSIQHGFCAIEDQSLVDILIDKKIRLNLTPASNMALGYIKDYQSHPLPLLLQQGVDVGLGTDDFAIFGQGISSQLAKFIELGLLTEEQVYKISAMALPIS